MEAFIKPKFTTEEIEKFEKFIDYQISKGYQQIRLSTGIVSEEISRLETYLGFHYPAGSFSNNPHVRYYRVAKYGKKYSKRENW